MAQGTGRTTRCLAGPRGAQPPLHAPPPCPPAHATRPPQELKALKDSAALLAPAPPASASGFPDDAPGSPVQQVSQHVKHMHQQIEKIREERGALEQQLRLGSETTARLAEQMEAKEVDYSTLQAELGQAKEHSAQLEASLALVVDQVASVQALMEQVRPEGGEAGGRRDGRAWASLLGLCWGVAVPPPKQTQSLLDLRGSSRGSRCSHCHCVFKRPKVRKGTDSGETNGVDQLSWSLEGNRWRFGGDPTAVRG